MKCKSCGRTIQDGSLFCNWCGKKQERDKLSISVPKPYVKADGTYTARMMINGTRFTVPPQDTEAKYYAVARAIKASGAVSDSHSSATLSDLMVKYVDENSNVLSPSTIRGYRSIIKNRFKGYVNKKADSVNYQLMVNDESSKFSPKTVYNAWGLVSASLSYSGVAVPNVNLPTVPEPDGDWLDFEQIPLFLEAIKGDTCEFVALAALHSLRESEILALKPDSISDGCIYVRGAVVPNEDNVFVYKETNKSSSSTRTVPVMMSRLLDVIPPSDDWYIPHPSSIRRHINNACLKAGLPEVGCHGLRRSFCSLAYYLKWSEMTTMKVGGWSDIEVVHKHYMKLSASEKNADISSMIDFYKGFELP